MGEHYDVILSDRAGNTSVNIPTGGLGGSEEATIRLAEQLTAKGKRVLVFTRDDFQDPVLQCKGVDYRRYGTMMPAPTCETLINLRHSRVPSDVRHDSLIEWVHDVPGDWCKHDHLPKERMNLVAVANWQMAQFGEGWKSARVIHPILPDFSTLRHQPVAHRFLFASSVIKGLIPTLTLWRFLQTDGKLPLDAELWITNPGYDANRVPQDLRPGERFIGTLPDMKAVADLMCTCEGLFYVNEWPENFSQTVAMADAIGLKTHVLCISDKGAAGLVETAPDNLVTTNQDLFISSFQMMMGKKIPEHRKAILGKVEDWLDLIDELGRLPLTTRNEIVMNVKEAVQNSQMDIIQQIDERHQQNLPLVVARKEAQDLYNAAFHKRLELDEAVQSPVITRYFHERFRPSSVIDFGSSTGIYIREWKKFSGEETKFTGLEFSADAVRDRLVPEVEPCDLTAPLPNRYYAEFGLCMEVAEHLPPEAADIFVQNLCGAVSNYIVFSAAVPNQGGTGHINCQPREYWTEKFTARGWVIDEEETRLMHAELPPEKGVLWWFTNNTFVLRNKKLPSRANVTVKAQKDTSVKGTPTETDCKRWPKFESEKAFLEFIRSHLTNTPRVLDSLNTMFSSPLLKREGTWIEFGVAAQDSLKRITAERGEASVWGIDCFTGLPEDWTWGRPDYAIGKGTFAQKSIAIPPLGAKVIAGLFDDVLPSFRPADPVTFVHIDSDLYSSCVSILTWLETVMADDMIIAFDELHSYEGWEGHEAKALYEWMCKHPDFEIEWIASSGQTNVECHREQSTIRIISNKETRASSAKVEKPAHKLNEEGVRLLSKICRTRSRILELGTGTSTALFAQFAAAGAQVISIDRDQERLSQSFQDLAELGCEERAIFTLWKSDIWTKLVSPHAWFDLVYLGGGDTRTQAFAIEAWDMIQPDGVLIIPNTLVKQVANYLIQAKPAEVSKLESTGELIIITRQLSLP